MVYIAIILWCLSLRLKWKCFHHIYYVSNPFVLFTEYIVYIAMSFFLFFFLLVLLFICLSCFFKKLKNYKKWKKTEKQRCHFKGKPSNCSERGVFGYFWKSKLRNWFLSATVGENITTWEQSSKHRKEEWQLAFWNKILTHERLNRRLIWYDSAKCAYSGSKPIFQATKQQLNSEKLKCTPLASIVVCSECLEECWHDNTFCIVILNQHSF